MTKRHTARAREVWTARERRILERLDRPEKIQRFLDALPYILTVVILAGFVGKAIPPRAGGEPYVKER